ncbi:hypothetical protein [Conservatibacter flavescens]|uniref:UvrABC system protein A n=1 Tax=Conservatibacter flavescens TaxID=28161 RepID=A0A2M8S5D9_9PAST|nr:hypothetical protein [Conservatibacter flavescens]PJG86347.1 hypothetical protein CVP05_00605 [Conservatibacter flavescens]
MFSDGISLTFHKRAVDFGGLFTSLNAILTAQKPIKITLKHLILHYQDIARLLALLQQITARGNTVIIIEHHLELIVAADYIIEMGESGGSQGGWVIFSGTAQEMLVGEESVTAEYLREGVWEGEEKPSERFFRRLK